MKNYGIKSEIYLYQEITQTIMIRNIYKSNLIPMMKKYQTLT